MLAMASRPIRLLGRIPEVDFRAEWDSESPSGSELGAPGELGIQDLEPMDVPFPEEKRLAIGSFATDLGFISRNLLGGLIRKNRPSRRGMSVSEKGPLSIGIGTNHERSRGEIRNPPPSHSEEAFSSLVIPRLGQPPANLPAGTGFPNLHHVQAAGALRRTSSQRKDVRRIVLMCRRTTFFPRRF